MYVRSFQLKPIKIYDYFSILNKIENIAKLYKICVHFFPFFPWLLPLPPALLLTRLMRCRRTWRWWSYLFWRSGLVLVGLFCWWRRYRWQWDRITAIMTSLHNLESGDHTDIRSMFLLAGIIVGTNMVEFSITLLASSCTSLALASSHTWVTERRTFLEYS